MAAPSSRRSSGPVLRSLSPSGRFHTANKISSSSSAFASSTSSSFSSPSSAFFKNHHSSHQRSASPTRVNLYTSASPTPSFRFSIDRSISPNRSLSVPKQNNHISFQKKTCMCSPTTHPGSFRCSLHKNSGVNSHSNGTGSYQSNSLNMRRSAMTNSLVRIGGVEGEWMKRSLRDLIRPSSHHQRRRSAFQPRPSRLCITSKYEDS